jgi:type IV secretion system protein VirD4
MDLYEVILVIDAQMPIRARKIKYFEDPALKVLHAGQTGSFPYPDEDGLRRDRQMTETRETVEKLRQELMDVRAAGVAKEERSQTVEDSNRHAKQA